MSSRIATSICIGGPIPHRLAPSLAETIGDTALSLDWGSKIFSPTNEHDLITAVNSDGVLFLCNDQASYGCLENLETFLHRHHIAFDRHSEAKYEYEAELIQFRPGMKQPHRWLTTQNGEILVPRKPIERLVAQLREGVMTLHRRRLRLFLEAVGPMIPKLALLRFTGRKQSSPSTIETSVTNLLGF